MSKRIGSNRGRSVRRSRLHIDTIPSTDSQIEAEVRFLRKRAAEELPLGGPVTHLTAEDYFANKIVEAALKV